jgi:hypothetical protein
MEHVVGAAAGAGDRARVDVGEELDVMRGVGDDRRFPPCPGGGVEPDGLGEWDGERAERIRVAKLGLDRERQVGELRVGTDPRELGAPVGDRAARSRSSSARSRLR